MDRKATPLTLAHFLRNSMESGCDLINK